VTKLRSALSTISSLSAAQALLLLVVLIVPWPAAATPAAACGLQIPTYCTALYLRHELL
jgi:hypothetical protein